MSYWQNRTVLVTGGASFIGSHLVDALLKRGARIRVLDAAKEVLRYTGHKAAIELRPEFLTGPYNRVASNSLAKRLLGWEPQVRFLEGLHRTIDWYFSSRSREQVQMTLERQLTER